MQTTERQYFSVCLLNLFFFFHKLRYLYYTIHNNGVIEFTRAGADLCL